ncbi:hypothetical protein F2P81_002369 [Scophthalmus maximus]|uniref:Uncharacterized protein n=1 Tax=Scophthalmus maximus TaxID=52904 RepID=A0A6A4TQH9_SCOMX|nr:hypothetical protein F2P81_002369 [Scophthalmus maximus]
MPLPFVLRDADCDRPEGRHTARSLLARVHWKASKGLLIIIIIIIISSPTPPTFMMQPPLGERGRESVDRMYTTDSHAEQLLCREIEDEPLYTSPSPARILCSGLFQDGVTDPRQACQTPV